MAISIHAPLTGSDPSRTCRQSSGSHFNPRSPYGERRVVRHGRIPPLKFQSTLPLRGATDVRRDVGRRQKISIHAPLTGSDSSRNKTKYVWEISIHAPLTGSDFFIRSFLSLPNHFNPRSPYGERPPNRRRRKNRTKFQSTLPLRGATARLHKILLRFLFK